MKCPNCQAELESGSKFCTKCGHAVPENTVSQEPAATEAATEAVVLQNPQPNSGVVKCAKCNAVLEGGAKFCTLCGHPVPEGVIPGDPPQFDFGKIMNQTKNFFATVWAKTKPACAKAFGKVKEAAKLGDSKLDEKLGEKKKMSVYAGIIALIGILIVGGTVIGLIPKGNGFVAYDEYVELDVYDETLYSLSEGKMTAIKTDAESVHRTSSSIDGKVTVFTDDENTLYVLKGKKAVKIADEVDNFILSLYGDYVIYVTNDDETTYYHCKVSSGKSVKFFEEDDENELWSYVLSPDGKSIAYIATDDEDADIYYFNGKKSTKVAECYGDVVGLSNGGKYIYAVDSNDSGKTYLYAYNKNGNETKIDSIEYSDFYFNLDATEIMFTSGGKTYVSANAKEPIKVASSALELLTPAGVKYHFVIAEDSFIYPVDTLFNHVYTSDNYAYFVSKKESKNIKLVKGSSFTLDGSAEYLYYMDKSDLMVLQISKGEKAEDKAKLIAEDISYYLVTADRKFAYVVNEDDELVAVNGKKGGKGKVISNDEVDASYYYPAIALAKDGTVYFSCDSTIYAAKGKKAGKKLMDDALCTESGGYVYIVDEDFTIYSTKGTSKPKKLMSLD